MTDSKEPRQELSRLVGEVSDGLKEEYYLKFSELFGEIELLEEYGPGPWEVWLGIAQALADASGFRVVLQAAILEPIPGETNTWRTVGQREIATADPTLFVNPA